MTAFRLITLALCLGLSGCVSSLHPLSSAPEAKPDVRLVGKWKYDKPGDTKVTDTGIVTVTKKGHGVHLHFVPTVVPGDTSPEKPSSYDAFTTEIGTDSYLNVVNPKETTPHTVAYQFFRYTVDVDGCVRAWNMDHDEVMAAIRAGTLKGDIESTGNGKNADITITDTSDNIVKFIQSSDVKKLFHDEFAEFYLVPDKK